MEATAARISGSRPFVLPPASLLPRPPNRDRNRTSSHSLVTTLARRFLTIGGFASFTFSFLHDSGRSLISSFHTASICLS